MLTGGFSRRGLEDEPTKELRLQAWLDDKFAFSPSLCPPSLTPSFPCSAPDSQRAPRVLADDSLIDTSLLAPRLFRTSEQRG